MNITIKNIDEIIPYENNPRINDDAVKYVKNSIKEFGIKQPLVIDKDNVIVAGHTRFKACKELNIQEIPCVLADDLTDEQIKAYRLIDNKTHEFSLWDFDLLANELDNIFDIDMNDYGFMALDENNFGLDNVADELIANETDSEYKYECPECGHQYN